MLGSGSLLNIDVRSHIISFCVAFTCVIVREAFWSLRYMGFIRPSTHMRSSTNFCFLDSRRFFLSTTRNIDDVVVSTANEIGGRVSTERVTDLSNTWL